MAAQNLSMAHTGEAVLRAFLRRADEEGQGKKNQIIISLNKILVRGALLRTVLSGSRGASSVGRCGLTDVVGPSLTE